MLDQKLLECVFAQLERSGRQRTAENVWERVQLYQDIEAAVTRITRQQQEAIAQHNRTMAELNAQLKAAQNPCDHLSGMVDAGRAIADDPVVHRCLVCSKVW